MGSSHTGSGPRALASLETALCCLRSPWACRGYSEGPREALRSQELASCRQRGRQDISLSNKETPSVLVGLGVHQHQRGRNIHSRL